MKLFSFLFSLASVGAVAFLVNSSAFAMPKKAPAGKSESQIEIGNSDDAPMNAKLVVDSASEVEAIAEAKSEHGSLSLPGETPAAPVTSKVGDMGAPAGGTITNNGGVDPVKKVDVSKIPENEIPVLTGAKDLKKSETGGYARLLITLGVLSVFLGALTFGLKRMASRNGKKTQNTKIKVLTTHALGPKKSISIIQVAGESILVGVTDHNISMLKTLSLIDDEFPEDLPRHFEAALSGHSDDDYAAPALQTRQRKSLPAPIEHDDFAMRGLSEIRDKVSTRLKNMKNL